MPIMVLSEVVPGESPEIGRIMFPGRNSTNGFNLTSYEVNPYEFGSWLGGRVQAFFPTRYLGTNMSDGTAQNDSQCVQGFDKLTFIQGSTTDAYNAYLIDAFYKIPIFTKRWVGLEARQSSSDDIPIPKGQEQNPLVEIVNQTASNFGQSFNASLWATYPNPFANYNDDMSGVDQLLLLDGSMTGETNPIRPLIIPERQVDFIIVYETSSDAKYHWVNGTNLISQSTTKISTFTRVFMLIDFYRYRPVSVRGQHSLPRDPRCRHHDHEEPHPPAHLLRLQLLVCVLRHPDTACPLPAQLAVVRLLQLLVHEDVVHGQRARRDPRERVPARHVRQRHRRRAVAGVSRVRGRPVEHGASGHGHPAAVRRLLPASLLGRQHVE